MLIQKSLKHYLTELSSDSPAPGGGSASALVGALGTCLVLMVGRISQKKSSPTLRRKWKRTEKYLVKCLRDIEEVIDLDAKVYQAVMSAYQKARNSKDRTAAQRKIETALSNSFRLQAELALLIAMVRQTLPSVFRFAKGSISNDLIVARGFLDGAFRGAVATARINLVYMKSARREHFERALAHLEKKYDGSKAA